VAKKDSPRKTTGKPGKTSATAARLKGPANKAVAAGPLKLGRAGPRLTKSPLSKAELAEFREMLLEKRRSIMGDMRGMTDESLRPKGSGNLSKVPIHDADVGSDNYEQEFTLGLLESELNLLAEINEALRRVDNGTYGICAGTGQPISKPRLRARPWAKYSIEYARMLEKGLIRPTPQEEAPPQGAPGGPEEDEEVEESIEEPEEPEVHEDERYSDQ
jgi:RNA polymerase-binding protein DksA